MLPLDRESKWKSWVTLFWVQKNVDLVFVTSFRKLAAIVKCGKKS